MADRPAEDLRTDSISMRPKHAERRFVLRKEFFRKLARRRVGCEFPYEFPLPGDAPLACLDVLLRRLEIAACVAHSPLILQPAQSSTRACGAD